MESYTLWLVISFVLSVVSVVAVIFTASKKQWGGFALALLGVGIFLLWLVPEFYWMSLGEQDGFFIDILDWVIGAIGIASPWIVAALAVLMGYGAYQAHGEKYVVDLSGVHAPAAAPPSTDTAPPPTVVAKEQNVLSAVLCTLSVGLGILSVYLFTTRNVAQPHPEFSHLVQVGKDLDRQTGTKVYDPSYGSDGFAITVPIESFQDDQKAQWETDTLKGLESQGHGHIRKIKLIDVRFKSPDGRKITKAVVRFYRLSDDGTKNLARMSTELHRNVPAGETKRWANDLLSSLKRRVQTTSGDADEVEEEGSYVPTGKPGFTGLPTISPVVTEEVLEEEVTTPPPVTNPPPTIDPASLIPADDSNPASTD